MNTSSLLSIFAFVTLTITPAAGAAILFSDNFNVANTANFDAAPLAGRRGGSLAGDVFLRSARTQQTIAGNQLSMVTAASGRLRFHNGGGWYDWAGGSEAANILAADSLRFEFDLTSGTSDPDWVSFNIGHLGSGAGEPLTRVNHPETDYGILLRGNGDTQRFDNGAGTITGSFAQTFSQQHVIIDFSFGSFADGSNVNVAASIGGILIDTYSFTWNNNGGALFAELGSYETGKLIDNYSVSTISAPPVPEPASMALFGILFLTAYGHLRKKRC
jgi:hypothetical protein